MCDDSPVDLTTLAPRRDHADLSLRFYHLRRQIGPTHIATALVVAGFALVVGSQWFGWFSIHEETFDAADSHIPSSFGMADTPSFLQVPYYLVWLAVFATSAAVLFAPESRRRTWFGAAAGALATQVLIVVPILRRPAIVIDGIIGDFSVEVHARHTAGSYFVIAAIAVIAVALGIAVRGRVLPLAVTAPTRSGVAPAPAQATRPELVSVDLDSAMLAALDSESGPETVAIDFGGPGRRPADTPSPDEPDIQTPDHSMYVRPTGTVSPRV
jgi:hypothetical protein